MKQSQLVESLRRVDPTSSAGLVRDNVDGKTAEPGNSDTLASGGRVVGVDVWMLLRGGEAYNLIEVKDCGRPTRPLFTVTTLPRFRSVPRNARPSQVSTT